jgi:predicted ATPase
MESDYAPERVREKANQFVVLSGCSGGGKSSLLAELGRRGFAIYEEPGRQVVKEQLLIGGAALPWGDVDLFLELTISRSIHHLVEAARGNALAFFDRGIVDQVSGYKSRGMEIPVHLRAAAEGFRYHETVFLVPPWQEIFANDCERRHSFADSVAMYEALVGAYERFGYRTVVVPKMGVSSRAEFVMAELGVG